MDVMLTITEDAKISGFDIDVDTITKATCLINHYDCCVIGVECLTIITYWESSPAVSHKFAFCQNLILGAADTNMVPLIWALALLLNNRQALKRAQEELAIHVGKDRHVDESDIKNLVSLQAIVKETFRLYPPGPILAL
ncbi:hypothetical protein REPUB_Repub09cG0173800 [Reevesia pubescens]